MGDHRDADRTELEESREPRVAAQRLSRQEKLLAFLRLARRTRADNGLATESIDQLIEQYQQELESFSTRASGRIVSRKRPRTTTTDTCTIFIDECGSHSLKAKESFDAFCLAAVIVNDAEFSELIKTGENGKPFISKAKIASFMSQMYGAETDHFTVEAIKRSAQPLLRLCRQL